MKGDEDGKPWAITFAARQPISVTFADDGFKVTIRGVNYFKGNGGHPAMNVLAAYKIEKSPEGFKAVGRARSSFPARLHPRRRPSIDAPRQIIRTLLEKRFAKVFEPEFLGEGFDCPASGKRRAS